MPKRKKIPKHGRKESHVLKDMARDAAQFSGDVPLGNTGPTVVQGVLEGGMPNKSRMARGRLKAQKGRYS